MLILLFQVYGNVGGGSNDANLGFEDVQELVHLYASACGRTFDLQPKTTFGSRRWNSGSGKIMFAI